MNLCVQCGQYNSTTHICQPRKFRYVAELPPGYDDRTTMVLGADNRVVIAHPDMPALILNEEKNVFVPIRLPKT